MASQVYVLKANGERELFDYSKVEEAIRRAGASDDESERLMVKLEKKLFNGITTREIYGIVFRLLEQKDASSAYKYNLRYALFSLGPEGHAFENFFAKVLSAHGYETHVRQVIHGKCVSHEVDVVAKKGSETFMVECKFHNTSGIKCAVQTTLYSYARFLDLKLGSEKGTCEKFTHAWLATNTKFTTEAIAYSQCMGIRLSGWRLPTDNSLEGMVESKKLYPITVVGFDDRAKHRLLQQDIVMLSELPKNALRLSDLAGVSAQKAEEIIEAAKAIS